MCRRCQIIGRMEHVAEGFKHSWQRHMGNEPVLLAVVMPNEPSMGFVFGNHPPTGGNEAIIARSLRMMAARFLDEADKLDPNVTPHEEVKRK